MANPRSAERENAKRLRLLLTIAPLPPPANGKFEIRIKGPAAAAGSEVRKNCVELVGFSPVVSLTSVPLEV